MGIDIGFWCANNWFGLDTTSPFCSVKNLSKIFSICIWHSPLKGLHQFHDKYYVGKPKIK